MDMTNKLDWNIQPKRLARYKHTSLFGPFISFEENEIVGNEGKLVIQLTLFIPNVVY
jgi:hypothetical protein